MVGGSAKVEGKEEKIEEREGKGENFQHKSVKALFIRGSQVTLNKKKFHPDQPSILCCKTEPHAGYFQEVNHK